MNSIWIEAMPAISIDEIEWCCVPLRKSLQAFIECIAIVCSFNRRASGIWQTFRMLHWSTISKPFMLRCNFLMESLKPFPIHSVICLAKKLISRIKCTTETYSALEFLMNDTGTWNIFNVIRAFPNYDNSTAIYVNAKNSCWHIVWDTPMAFQSYITSVSMENYMHFFRISVSREMNF